jgi:hypothetical protein
VGRDRCRALRRNSVRRCLRPECRNTGGTEQRSAADPPPVQRVTVDGPECTKPSVMAHHAGGLRSAGGIISMSIRHRHVRRSGPDPLPSSSEAVGLRRLRCSLAWRATIAASDPAIDLSEPIPDKWPIHKRPLDRRRCPVGDDRPKHRSMHLGTDPWMPFTGRVPRARRRSKCVRYQYACAGHQRRGECLDSDVRGNWTSALDRRAAPAIPGMRAIATERERRRPARTRQAPIHTKAPPQTATGPCVTQWAWEELNLRPHAYQACALTT